MKASELIEQLQFLIAAYGDREIVADNYDYGSAPQLCATTSAKFFEQEDYIDENFEEWSYGSLSTEAGEGRRLVFVIHPLTDN